MSAAVHKRALQRAIELAGGAEPLARQLGVAPTAVRFWLNGSSPLPGDIFLKVVDRVLDHSMADLKSPQGAGARAGGRNAPES